MGFENIDMTGDLEEPEGTPPEESSNRMFLIAAGVLGAIALLSLICIAVYALLILPERRTAQNQQKATLDARNTQVAAIINSTSTAAVQAAIEAAYTPTASNTPLPPPFPATSLPTPVVAVATSVVPGGPTLAPEMATATALYPTLTANALLYAQTQTARPPIATQIPDTGFADEVGLPLMLGMAALLVAIIFLARRLRTSPS